MGAIKKRKCLLEIRLEMAIKGADRWTIDETIKDIEKRRQKEDEADARVKAEAAAPKGVAEDDDFALPSKTQNNFIECGGCQ
jgi:hypothetical protein